MGAELVASEDLDLTGALVIVAFPTTGMAASIAAHYLVRRLNLPLVGQFRVPGVTGVVAIQDGLATGPVRIYGGEVECKLAGGCPRVYIVASELAMPPEPMRHIATGIVDAAKSGNARMVVVLEGVVRGDEDDTPDVYCAATRPDVLHELQKGTKVDPAPRALIVGMCAEVLHRGDPAGVASGAIIVEARPNHPDARAAAALVEALDRFLPDIEMDAQPLLEDAEELEEMLRSQQREAEAQITRPSPTTFI